MKRCNSVCVCVTLPPSLPPLVPPVTHTHTSYTSSLLPHPRLHPPCYTHTHILHFLSSATPTTSTHTSYTFSLFSPNFQQTSVIWVCFQRGEKQPGGCFESRKENFLIVKPWCKSESKPLSKEAPKLNKSPPKKEKRRIWTLGWPPTPSHPPYNF